MATNRGIHQIMDMKATMVAMMEGMLETTATGHMVALMKAMDTDMVVRVEVVEEEDKCEEVEELVGALCPTVVEVGVCVGDEVGQVE